MAHQTRLAGYAGFVAAVSLVLSPAQAQAAETASLGAFGYSSAIHTQFSATPGSPFDASTYDADVQNAEWRRCGWRGCWRGHRRGIRGGDVLAGVLVLGGIAAIASAASNNNRRRDRDVVVVERERVRDNDRTYDYRPENRRTNRSTTGGSGIDNAVSQCLNEIEQDVRVDSVDGASRIAQGWVVTGILFNGSGFTCQIDNSGRISNIDYGGFSGSAADGQWSDQSYADARGAVSGQSFAANGQQPLAASGQQPLVPLTADNLPAYPGGPVPGETYED